MNIKNIGHSMKYEAECIAMLFFPDEKIVTTEYPADEEEHEELLVQQEQKAPAEDCIETRLQNGLMKVTLSLDGKQTRLCRTILSEPHSPYEKAEFVMSDMIYTLLSQATGIHPAWGMVTGVRPVKLFHRRLDEGKTPQMVAREFEQHFYVTQEKIELALETARHEAPILREVTDDTFSLYISIPFCPSRCSYCSFVSHDITSKRAKDILPVYVDRLCEELEQISQKVKGTGLRLTTVYFGGGTPSFFGAGGLAKIFAEIDRRFDVSRDAEVSLEANPDSVTLPMLTRLRRAGFNRISIGVQSDDDAQLKALGRPHNYRQAQQAVSLSRRAGFDNVSVDLMFGLPNQSRESWMQTLRNVIDLKADHISCYGLKVEPGTKLWSYKDCANLPDDDAQADMYFYAVETLEQFGYHQYEISNFAHDGFICRHNMKYWVGDEYLGFGPCAASDFAGRRFTIKPDLEGYIKGVMDKGQILSESELVPLRERAGEYLMLRLRTVDGIEKGEYTRSFLLPFEPIEEILLRLQTQEYAAFTSGRWHLTPKGFMLSNTILVELLEAQQKSKPLAQRR